MARPPQRAPQTLQQDEAGGPGAPQRSTSKYIVFGGIDRINTRSARDALPEDQAAWLENLQPIAPNYLLSVPAAILLVAANPSLPYTFTRKFAANIGNTDYIIRFHSDGSASAFNTATLAVTPIAPAGTFSDPDMTVYASERILIIDPTAGYCTWDGTVFTRSGGVSPNVTVTAGGTGYSTAPTVTITGGTGSGVIAHATVSGGAVIDVAIDNPGTGFSPGDVLTVHFGGPGTGATAVAIVWPNMVGSTIAVFQGRAWIGNGRVLGWTGTNGIDDVGSTSAGSTVISDADLSHDITALRTLNNYLYIFGDTSVRQIGNITVQSGITLFTPLILASDIGTTFRLTIQSYNRLVLFCNKQGVYAIFGASVEKISDDLDGIFQLTDFTQAPQAAVNDMRNIHTFVLLLRYIDPIAGTRSLLCVFQDKRWFVASQGDSLQTICTVPLAATAQIETFGSSTTDVVILFQDNNATVSWVLQTSLTPHGNLIQTKQALHAGVQGRAAGPVSFNFSLDTENGSNNYQLEFISSTVHQFPYKYMDGYGKMLGATLSGTSAKTVLHAPAIEYQDADMWGLFG